MWYIAGLEIEDRNQALVANLFLWSVLAVIILASRLYTRIVLVRQMGVDDYLMCCALLASLGFFTGAMLQVKYGLGKEVDPDTIVPFLHSLLATIACYNTGQTLYKLSIATQSYRLFSTSRGQKIMIGLVVWIVACGIMTICGSIFYCFPVAKAWDDSIEGWCVNRNDLLYSISAFNILNDIFLVAIPFPFLCSLQVAPKQRLVLCSVFACGVIVTIVSCVRLKYLWMSLVGPVEMQTVTGVEIALWSHLELNLAIICGSVPSLKAFVSRVILGHTTSSGAYSSGHAYGTSSLKRSRLQSHVLASRTGDEENGMAVAGAGNHKQLAITVEQSIEMKSYVADDTGSEHELIVPNGLGAKKSIGRANGNVTTVSGGQRRSG